VGSKGFDDLIVNVFIYALAGNIPSLTMSVIAASADGQQPAHHHDRIMLLLGTDEIIDHA
jgi:hypothetical protein